MMKTEVLISDLIERTRKTINKVEQWRQLPFETLNWKPSPDSWSVLECIKHLNLYGDFYLPEIEQRINKSTFPFSEKYKAGLLGEYFAKSMLPKEKLNTMRTFKSMNPNGSNLSKDVLNTFIVQQQEILELLNQSRKVSLQKTKTAISISKWIKLRLGDTFRVVIYHNQRHVVQAEKVLELN